ncbi:MAG: hypothetical protein QW532_03185 [Archaeoglobaceae archaeon]
MTGESLIGSLATPVTANGISSAELEKFEDLRLIKIDPIFDSTPYGFFIAVGATEEGRKATLFYIEQSSLRDEEKKSLKKSMEELWNKYEVKAEIEEKVVFVTAEKEISLAKEDEEILEKLAKAFVEFWKKQLKIEPKWAGNAHGGITYLACRKVVSIGSHCQIAQTNSSAPDYWSGYVPPNSSPPCNIPQWMWDQIRTIFLPLIVRNYDHWFNPNLCPGGIGGAPAQAENNTRLAKIYWNLCRNGNLYYCNEAFRYLGYASHFLEDVGNPLHTSAEVKQISFSIFAFSGCIDCLHKEYENYIDSNWQSGYNFSSVVEENLRYSNGYTVTNVTVAVKNLATGSNVFGDSVVYTIFTQPGSWQRDQTLRSITNYTLAESAKYAVGLFRSVVLT